MPLAFQQFKLFFHLGATHLRIAYRGPDRWGSFPGDMSQIIRKLFQGPAGLTRAMRKIVAQIMKREVSDQLPLLVVGLTFEATEPLVNPIFSEPRAPLGGKDVGIGALTSAMLEVVIQGTAIHLAERQVRQGASVWMNRFDWESPAFGGVLVAAHAMDIPFVWKTLDTEIARRFTGDSPTRQPLADRMHAAWAAFIRSGTPAIASLPAWPPYDLERRATMIFNDVPHVVDDPQGQVRTLWEQVLREQERRG
jgi:carboxylesterase type B